jgi:hypothetical protein
MSVQIDGRTHFVGDDCDPPHVEETELTLDQISGMMHKASLARSRIEELNLTAQRDHERIDFHLAQATEVDRKLLAETIATVGEFWRKRVSSMQLGERQSVGLAWGRLEARKVGKKIERVDAQALVDWCLTAPDEYTLIPKIKVTPDWKKIKADIAAGKLKDVPGVEITETDDYTVTVKID